MYIYKSPLIHLLVEVILKFDYNIRGIFFRKIEEREEEDVQDFAIFQLKRDEPCVELSLVSQ